MSEKTVWVSQTMRVFETKEKAFAFIKDRHEKANTYRKGRNLKPCSDIDVTENRMKYRFGCHSFIVKLVIIE